MRVEIPVNGSKNALVVAYGVVVQRSTFMASPLCTFEDLGSPRSIGIESVTWAIREKGGLILRWSGIATEESLIFPLESRGHLNWEGGYCPRSPPGATGIILLPFGNLEADKEFRIHLDLRKGE